MGNMGSISLDPWTSCSEIGMVPPTLVESKNPGVVHEGTHEEIEDPDLQEALAWSYEEHQQELDEQDPELQEAMLLSCASAAGTLATTMVAGAAELSPKGRPPSAGTGSPGSVGAVASSGAGGSLRWLRPPRLPRWHWARVWRYQPGSDEAPSFVDGEQGVDRLEGLLASLGLQRSDVGSQNVNEEGVLLSNQCFYLALAHSWRSGAAPGDIDLGKLAMKLKRKIEASVCDVRGAAALRDVGEEEEAYADFLACALCAPSPSPAAGEVAETELAHLAVVVFASDVGSADVYEGRCYAKQKRAQRVANLAVLWHRPGHFEAVLASEGTKKFNLTLEELLTHIERAGIPTAVVKG